MPEAEAIYCTLNAEEQAARRCEVRAKIVPHVTELKTRENGLEINFLTHEGLSDVVQEFIVLEQSCCSFLSFSLSSVEENLSLRIEGPPNTAHIIDLFRQTALGRDQ